MSQQVILHCLKVPRAVLQLEDMAQELETARESVAVEAGKRKEAVLGEAAAHKRWTSLRHSSCEDVYRLTASNSILPCRTKSQQFGRA